MEFIAFIVVIVVVGFIALIISNARQKRLKRKIEEIRRQYPLAFKDFISKNHIYISNAKSSTLCKIVERSSNNWNEDENRLQEQEKKRKETESKYNKISKSYPEGLKKWKRLNPNSSHERIVANEKEIKGYDRAIREAQEYDKWEQEQEEFAKKSKDLGDELLPGFGCYQYEVPFRKANDEGWSIDGKYKVWQFFAGSYCLESDLDYADFECIKETTNELVEFKNNQRHYVHSVYEAISSFVVQLSEVYPVSIYFCANNRDWNVQSLYYHYNLYGNSPFCGFPSDVEMCDYATDAVNEGTEIDYDNYPKLKNRHIVIVEMQTENNHLKKVCKNIIEKNKKNRPLITYISFLKGYDREEMMKLIDNKKRKRKEEEERQRKEKEAEERKKAESRRIAKEAEEQNRLDALTYSKKNNSQSYIDVLKRNGITCLYHFTDKSNLKSIKEHGGLFSWSYCDEHGITIPMPGGGGLSRMLDRSRGLQDYVRLCFTKNHPMMYVARNEGRITNPVLLEIDLEVVTLDSTKFSNKNATIKRESVNIGETLNDLKQIHFNTVKRPTHFDLDADEKSYFQAEVLVKTFVPIKYIKNINSPLYV